jgi:hypothetical protein
MIVKLQRSLTEPEEVLMYNLSRRIQWQTPMTPEFAAKFGDRVKIFCNARVEGTSIEIFEEVEDPGW